MGNESTEISESSLHTISDFEIKLEVEDQSPISILQDIEAIIDQRNIKSNAPRQLKAAVLFVKKVSALRGILRNMSWRFTKNNI